MLITAGNNIEKLYIKYVKIKREKTHITPYTDNNFHTISQSIVSVHNYNVSV